MGSTGLDGFYTPFTKETHVFHQKHTCDVDTIQVSGFLIFWRDCVCVVSSGSFPGFVLGNLFRR